MLIMTCREAIYSENVLDYIVNAFSGNEVIEQRYNPLCITEIDRFRAIAYKQEEKINSESIGRFGYGTIPHVYGLMADEALEASGVSKIRRQPYLDLYGQGILVGIVDTGIDFTHPAFLNADNTTRIHSIWDQTIREGGDVKGFQYGREFTQEEINEALRDEEPLSLIPSRDENGHGTFLAGIAAGNEMRQQDFSGVAPLSELVIVKCKEAKNSYREFYRVPSDVPCFQENDVMCGISYILRVAQETKRQVAICIGMGGNLGNHDGETPLCSMIDYMNMLSGVCIVTCVGNEGNARHHYHLTKEREEIDINVELSSQGFVCELWWRTPGILRFDVVSPAGTTLGITRATTHTKIRKLFTVENTLLEVLGGEEQQQTRDQVVMFRFENSKAGIWKILVDSEEAEVDFHMWLPITQFLYGETAFVRPDPNVTICEPGNSRRAISLSAYDPADGALFLQASRGFTPSGIVKPDVTAPGVKLYGPLPKNNYGSMTGTGVATALTAGIAALYMQQYSNFVISGNSVRELLIRGADQRGEGYPNREWGYGTVNAFESIFYE